jgi:hypothetical protein
VAGEPYKLVRPYLFGVSQSAEMSENEQVSGAETVTNETTERRMIFGIGANGELYVKRNGTYTQVGTAQALSDSVTEAKQANTNMSVRFQYGTPRMVPVSVSLKNRYVYVAMETGDKKRKMVKTQPLDETKFSELQTVWKA